MENSGLITGIPLGMLTPVSGVRGIDAHSAQQDSDRRNRRRQRDNDAIPEAESDEAAESPTHQLDRLA